MSNPELVKAFKAAKRRMVQGKSSFICHALLDAQHYGTISYFTMLAAKRVIMGRLCGQSTLEMWLRWRHGIPADPHYSSADRYRARETRIAWLNSLIKEFSK